MWSRMLMRVRLLPPERIIGVTAITAAIQATYLIRRLR